MTAEPAFSIVIPAYNEEKNIPILHQEIVAALGDQSYEIIIVDDASTDGTVREIEQLCSAHPNVRGIRLFRNTRKGHALEIGFREAKGNVIVTIDADLQDNPQEIYRLLEEIDAGHDVVIGWKRHRKDSLLKRVPSIILNYFVRVFFGLWIHDMNSGLKAYRREAVEHLSLPGSLYRFIPVLLYIQGFSVREIPIEHRARRHGTSKFGFMHRMRGMFDFFTVLFLYRFGERPLHFFGSIGSVILLAGLSTGTYLTVIWFQGESIGRRPLLLLSVLCVLVGMQLISIGLLGELFIRTHPSKEQLPHYKSV